MAINSGNGLVYMGDTLVAGEFRQPYTKANETIARTKTVAASAHAQDPGTPTQVIASTTEDYHHLWVSTGTATGGQGLNGSLILEIWFGAASSEVLQASFIVGNRNASATISHTLLSCPFYIPSGTRVSYTTRSGRTGQSVNMLFRFGFNDSPIPDQPVSSSVDTAASRGIVINNPTSANTWGTWTEIWSSTPTDFQGLHVSLGLGSNTATVSCVGRMQIGIGASSSEVALIKEIRFEVSTTEVLWFQPGEGPYYLNHIIPAGSRVSMRFQHTVATVGDVDVVLNGVPI